MVWRRKSCPSAIHMAEIRKRVQRTLMILDGLSIPFDAVDITKPGNEKERMFMREHAIKEDVKGTPLPPQFFYNEEYLGNYVDFEEAVEDDRIAEFLRLLPETLREKHPVQCKPAQNAEDKENHVDTGELSLSH
ncbi:SH3-binding, glutamic acid-rich protein [Oesophagostomum dentatum]|uniref:SH3-binding, glutamic acid-rich protein n=1 Tax=Oesophagostomum dentatum TaxID=61180 RepID=A0A0B1TM65_OESDE|nr:SH3-binding, glutamic acid-rich protein [Oesophagostomum dentatum]